MSLLPILLGVRLAPDADGMALAGRSLSKAQVEKVLHRDGFSCRCCGFTSKRFQRVIPTWDPSDSKKDDQLITVCTFCEACFVLDKTGLFGGGTLIWLPEISQADLNHIVRAIYVARKSEDALAKTASRALDVLMERRLEAKKRLGADDPLLLATALAENLDQKTYAARAAKMEGLRLLPSDKYFVRQKGGEDDIFPQMLSYWTSPQGPFGQKPVSEWGAMFEGISSAAQG